MKKRSHKLFALCLVCIMTLGICGVAYAEEASPVIKEDSQSGVLTSGGVSWEQPEGCGAFRLSVWNQGGEAVNITTVYPDGRKERRTLQSGLNKVISVDNNAPAGKYEMDFATASGVVSGKYEVTWSAESLTSDPAFVSEAPPVTSAIKSGIIPSGGLAWKQPEGYGAFRLSVWNQGGEALKVTLAYPDGRKEQCTLQSGANKVIAADNDASAGRYEMDFDTPSGVVAGEYGVRWSAEAFASDPAFVSEMSPVTSGSKFGRNPIGSTVWDQPDGHRAFSVRVWNQGGEALNVTINYPDGKKEERTLQPGVNKVIYVDNDVTAGKYEIHFATASGSGVVSGEYEVTWSTVPL